MESEFSGIEEKFYKLISDYIEERGIGFRYSIIRQPRLTEFSSVDNIIRWRPDFLILKGPYPYMVIEVVTRQTLRRSYQQKKYRSNDFKYDLELIGADFLLVTDLNRLLLIGYNEDLSFSDLRSFNHIFSLLDENLRQQDLTNLKASIARVFYEEIQKYSQFRTEEFRDVDLTEQLDYNADGRFFHFKADHEGGFNNFENLFFQALLEPVTDNSIYRYTTLETLYYTLNNGSYRMASHVAMNDRGEVDYVDKYIGVFYKPLQNMTLADVEELNKNYISSCTTIEDDLTMYRLYGDDSRGVCLCFDVDINIDRNSNLLIKHISYGLSRTNHPELDLIKNILDKISLRYKLRFRFLYLDIWKHFFKSSDYSVEKEVRVLYLDNGIGSLSPNSSGWVIASPSKVLSKYVTFDLATSGFPLLLYKIILGPNCPEQAVNKLQFEVLLNEKGLTNVVVEKSEIESYRKT